VIVRPAGQRAAREMWGFEGRECWGPTRMTARTGAGSVVGMELTSPNATTAGRTRPATAASPADPAWWAPGLALHERGRGGHALPPADPSDTFALRIADLGLDAGALRALRAESSAALAARVPRPEWAVTAERVVRAAVPVTATAELGETWRDAFGRVLRPLVDDALGRILAEAGPLARDGNVDLPQVVADVGMALRRRLVDLAARALVDELHRWRAEERLHGADGRARFLDFARGIAAPAGLFGLLSRFPILARLLAQAATAAVTATLELLERFAADRQFIVDALLGGTDPGPVVAVRPGIGDQHCGGRSVAFVDFGAGQRIVYKPRDVTTQVRFGRFIDALAAVLPELCPRAARTIACAGYGWSEYVPGRELTGTVAAARFYWRQGALLALLHVLRTTDMHYENVIAHGELPVVIDTETMFNAELVPSGTGDPAADMLAASVYRTALLPLMVVGERGIADLSGLGGDHGAGSPSSVVDWLDAGTDRMRLTRRSTVLAASANRPRHGGVEADPADHVPAIVAGFRRAYTAISEHRADFAALIEACASLEVRVVIRPSWMYSTLLDETTHPDVLRDGLDRDEALSLLYANRTGDQLFAQFLRHELDALWAGDVPMFLAAAGSGELRTPAGTRLPVPLRRAGIAAALDTLAGLNEVDRREQEWIIKATLATRRGGPAHPRAGRITAPVPTAVVHPDALIAAACAVADRIVAHTAGERRINWLGLEAVDDQWLVLPMGAGLGSGYLGVAVFLAQLATVTGVGRYAEHARRAVGDTPAWIDAFIARPELVDAVGWGGLTGLGGITYGLAQLGRLLDDAALRDSAQRLVGLAGTSSSACTDSGWAGGLAGCLAAMVAVRADLGFAGAETVARDCADRLAGMADQDAGALPLSFADGLAGIGWALARLGPEPRHRAAGRRVAALVAARSTPGRGGWCQGGAGLALAGGCVPEQVSTADLLALADGPVCADLSLCHGELGITEVLADLASMPGRHPGAADALARHAGQALEMLRRRGPVCGVPGDVATPGLLSGLAGIGHGFLRLAVPHQVPSVLLLQPASCGPEHDQPQ
jgi:class II lanthipeptide synthase